ncbi:MAG: glycosyltransferase family 2 protein [Clostridia bacterium]|nr:glycosyltransferase family 2 protein [Clostridia bacterium]
MNTVVLIPAYNPGESMLSLIDNLKSKGFEILIVNDGSDASYSYLFESAAQKATVIGYDKNRGKGYALKHGIKHLSQNKKDITGFVTADADGQHSAEDIERVARTLENTGAIVLGLRDLSGKIPFRSRVGNDMSRLVYTFVTGKYLRDNQSGLRGFPIELAEWLLTIKGRRYEYEMNTLIKAAKNRFAMVEIPIQTIYESGNKSSHFHPVPDTARIQGQLLLNGLFSSLLYILCLVTVFIISQFGLKYSLLAKALAVTTFLLIRLLTAYTPAMDKFRCTREAVLNPIIVIIKYAVMALLFELLYYFTQSAFISIILPLLAILAITYISGRLIPAVGSDYRGKMRPQPCADDI